MHKVCGTNLGAYGHTGYHQDMRREFSGGDRWKHFCAMMRLQKAPFVKALSVVLMPARRFVFQGGALHAQALLDDFLPPQSVSLC